MKRLLLTGASGNLGRMLAKRLTQAGYWLRLSDIAPFPDAMPENAEFIQADLMDAGAITELVRGMDAILHFGGISVEQPYDAVAKANLLGVTHVLKRQGLKSSASFSLAPTIRSAFILATRRLARMSHIDPTAITGFPRPMVNCLGA